MLTLQMKCEIFIDKPARKFIEKQPKPQKLRLYAAIMRFPEGAVKPFKGTDMKRLRVGDHRIIYEQYEEAYRIIVISADNRGDVYKAY